MHYNKQLFSAKSPYLVRFSGKGPDSINNKIITSVFISKRSYSA